MSPTTDYRLSPRSPSSSRPLLNVSVVDETERLFERTGVAQEIIDLLDKKLLKGAEVLTYHHQVSPPANVEFRALPLSFVAELRERPDPHMMLHIRMGWQDVRVHYESATTLFIPDRDLGEVSRIQDSDNLNHYIWINGKDYEILEVIEVTPAGTYIRIAENVESALSTIQSFRGTIYNGAEGCRLEIRRVHDNKRVATRIFNNNGRRPQLDFMVPLLPGQYRIKMTFTAEPAERRVVVYERSFGASGAEVPAPPVPEVVAVRAYQRYVVPSASANPVEIGDVRLMSYVAVTLRREQANQEVVRSIQASFNNTPLASVIGLKEISIPASDLSAQTTLEKDVTVTLLLLQSSESVTPEGVTITLISESGRPFYKEVVTFDREVAANISLPGIPHLGNSIVGAEMRDAFGSLVQQGVQPLSIDPEELERDVHARMDEVRAYAETLSRAHAANDIKNQSS